MKMGKGQQSKRGRAREGVRKGMSMAQEHWTAQWNWGVFQICLHRDALKQQTGHETMAG